MPCRCVLVVPFRQCAGLWLGLGAVLACFDEKTVTRDLAPGTRVRFLPQGKTRFLSGTVDGPDPIEEHLYRVRHDREPKRVDSLPREQLFVSDRKITLEGAREAEQASQFAHAMGIGASPDCWLDLADSVVLAGSKAELRSEACALDLSIKRRRICLGSFLMISEDHGKHAVTRLVSSETDDLPVDKSTMLAILDGPDAVRFMEFDGETRDRGISRSRVSAVLLLTEHEFARERERIADCLRDWNGSTVDGEQIADITAGLSGTSVLLHCKVPNR